LQSETYNLSDEDDVVRPNNHAAVRVLGHKLASIDALASVLEHEVRCAVAVRNARRGDRSAAETLGVEMPPLRDRQADGGCAGWKREGAANREPGPRARHGGGRR